METEEYKMPVTVEALAIHRGLKMVDDHYTGEDIAAVGLAILGGCCRCAATIAAYNAYPSKNGYWMCGDCIGDNGYATVEEANEAIFGVKIQPPTEFELQQLETLRAKCECGAHLYGIIRVHHCNNKAVTEG